MNICPTSFGPYFWTVIHMACLSAGKNISDEKAGSLTQFFDSMPGILPCKQCGKHLKENLQILPFDREDPFRWSVELHNLVNTQLNKPEVEFDKALRYWSTKCTSGPSKQNWVVILLSAIIVVLFLIIIRNRA
ncbi:hypothetical protein EBT25_12500 [bacterium]|nr:hypothetical protein [bacterium]